jgi:uroporphyrinogen decarboxylase
MMWQVEEVGRMVEEDYDVIINKGWTQFEREFIPAKLKNAAEDMQRYLSTDFSKVFANYLNAGIVPLFGAAGGPPFDTLAGARCMSNFIKDLFRIPDKWKPPCR